MAKEFVACQNDDSPGVLILSPFAGAGGLMHEALMVSYFEVVVVIVVVVIVVVVFYIVLTCQNDDIPGVLILSPFVRGGGLMQKALMVSYIGAVFVVNGVVDVFDVARSMKIRKFSFFHPSRELVDLCTKP